VRRILDFLWLLCTLGTLKAQRLLGERDAEQCGEHVMVNAQFVGFQCSLHHVRLISLVALLNSLRIDLYSN